MRTICLATMILLIGGCAITNETLVLVGTRRPAITPEQVKLYTAPPKRFLEIAIVSADASHAFMAKQALVDKAVHNAKIQAAKVGANGILIEGLGDYGSAGVAVASRPVGTAPIFAAGSSSSPGKQLSGKAIYVLEE